ncbi:MAG: DNA-formamidopyrimidine glycosylase family protein, partial [Patescibacteria group bacterium]
MPELPEVEVVKRGLSELIVGQTIHDLKSIDSPKSLLGSSSDLKQFAVGAKITGVRRRGKLIIIDLSSDYCLVVHLKMTGQLVYRSNDDKSNFGAGHPTDSLVGSLPDRSTRATIKLENGILFFNDQRKFGWIRLIHNDLLDRIKLYKTMGPEPLDGITQKHFNDNLSRRANSRIKPVILDQQIIAGVGNIYADESLWMSEIHPSTRVKDIPESSRTLLLESIIDSMKTS